MRLGGKYFKQLPILILLGMTAGVLFGQSISNGKLTGLVTDENGQALPGVVVEVTSKELISGKRTTLSSERGTYVFLNLPSGTYRVRASMDGFKTFIQDNIYISAASAIALNPIMRPGDVAEELTVTSTATMDLSNSTVDTRLDGEMLEKLPTSRDSFYDLSLTAPGMSDVGADGSWLTSPTAYGGATNENVFLVNGVNTTNPRGSSWGSLVTVNYNTVKEVRVISLGTKAEYGSFSGAAIDVVTESGGNDYHGKFGFYAKIDAADNQPGTGEDFGSDWLYTNEGTELMTRPEEDREFNLTFGGPLMKDKVWFYVGLAGLSRDIDTPTFEPMKEYRGELYDLKISAEPFEGHHAWVSIHHEKTDNGNESWGDDWDRTMVYDQHRKNDTISAQWQWFPTGRTFFTAKYLGFWTDDEPTANDEANHAGYINWWKWDRYGVGGAFPYVEAQKSKRETMQVDVTHYAEDFLGEHDMKFGVQSTRAQGNWMGGYFHGNSNTAYPSRWSRNPSSYPDDTGLEVYVVETSLNPFLTVRESDTTGFFFDDQWKINETMTVNLGLRYDHMEAGYGTGKVYEQPATPGEINGPPPVLRNRGGAGEVLDFETWSPRLGFTWVIGDDQKTVLKAHYGRYYSPIDVESLRRFGPDMPETSVRNLFYSVPWSIADADGDDYVNNSELQNAIRELPNLTPYNATDPRIVDTSWQLNVADGVKDPHTDQFTLSLEREVIDNFTVRGSYIYKKTSDMMGLWPINRQTGEGWEYETMPYTTSDGNEVEVYSVVLQDYNGDGATDFQDVRWIWDNSDQEIRNFGEFNGQKAERTYQGFQLDFHKHPTNNWQIMGSLLYNKTDGLASRTTTQDWFIDGGMIMDTPFVSSVNQLVNNMSGPMPFTPEFEVKLSGYYQIPKVDVDFGFRLRYNTGRPLWPIENVPSYQAWDSGLRDEPVVIGPNAGQAGTIVTSNPDDPRFLPDMKILDVNFGREFNLGRAGLVGASIDVLNVLNADIPNKVGFTNNGDLGEVKAVTSPRLVRLSVKYQF